MSTSALCKFPYKYGPKEWRSEPAQSFRQISHSDTKYTVVDGQTVETVETLWEWVDPTGAVASVPCAGPGYFFADSTYRADPAETFQKTHIKTTTWDAYGVDAYLVTIDDYNVLTGVTTRTTSIVNGQIPLAPTVKSAMSNLVLQAFVGGLTDECIGEEFVNKREAFNVAWAENQDQVDKAARRKLQRESAITRTLTTRNLLVKLLDTVELKDPARMIDDNHLVVGRTVTVNPTQGAKAQLQLEDWPR